MENVKPKRPPIDKGLLHPAGSPKKSSLPGFNGVPFRGNPPFLKNDDPAEKQPQLGYDVRVDIFLMNDDDDREYYGNVWQMVSLGYAVISAEDKQYDSELKTWRIFLRWALAYSYASEEAGHGQVR